ncbi:MAG: ABC transporter permease [Oscillospiraceae bacterium]|nr:ABC transporter permease [Oscillospiraceae bacterium]
MYKSLLVALLFNHKTKSIILINIASVYIVGVFIWGMALSPADYSVNFNNKFISPCPEFLFGTDFLGRDMFFRSMKGLSNSIVIGLAASAISSLIAIVFGISSAAIGGKFDKFVMLCVDCCMGLPHLVLLILISFMLGRGAIGVTLGVAFTHWPELTRLIRAEVLSLRRAHYVNAAYKMGKSRLYVISRHMLPHVIPVYITGLVLLFPHAILHESAITFLGFGLPAETPAIGVILSESMRHIAAGKWWLALFPGIMLATAVILFDAAGESLKHLMNSRTCRLHTGASGPA